MTPSAERTLMKKVKNMVNELLSVNDKIDVEQSRKIKNLEKDVKEIKRQISEMTKVSDDTEKVITSVE